MKKKSSLIRYAGIFLICLMLFLLVNEGQAMFAEGHAINQNYQNETDIESDSYIQEAVTGRVAEAADKESNPEETKKPIKKEDSEPKSSVKKEQAGNSKDEENDGDKKLVALTFDDGPDSVYTAKVLDVLKQYNVKATFFVVGKQVKKYPEVVKRVAAEGHAIGSHTWGHANLTSINENELKRQVVATENILNEVLGYSTNLIRPPYGSVNKKLTGQLNDMGYHVVLWSVDTRDWAGKPVGVMMDTVRKQLRPGGIILQHSAGAKSFALANSVELLPQLITELRAKGYTFVTVPELINE